MAGSPHPGTIRHPRLVAYQQLLKLLNDGQSIWTDFLQHLPLTLGESSVDRVVTYSVSDHLHRTLLTGLDGLLDLLKRRRDPAYDREKQTAMLTSDQIRVVLWPRRFCPRTLPETDPLRAVVRLALLESPSLDGGLLESWLSDPGGGRALCQSLMHLLSKAFHVAFHRREMSGIGLMTHMAMLNTLLDIKQRVKRFKVSGLSYARLERTTGMALHACFRQAFDGSLAAVGRPPVGSPEHTDLMVALVSLGPLAFFSIRNEELNEDINAYGLSREVEQLLMPAYQDELERNNQPQVLLDGLMSVANRPGPLRGSLLQHAGIEVFRRLSLDHLVAGEDPAIEADQLLAFCYASNTGTRELMENKPVLAQIAGELSGQLQKRRQHAGPWRETQRLLQMVERLRDQGTPWSQPAEADQIALQEMIERFLLHRLDEFSDGHLAQARRRVVDRRPGSDSVTMKQEFEAGHLYRLSTDDHPFVKERVVKKEGQLFVDLKGYTRRTALAKELVMSEFLKTEFYEPIMEAARRYQTGAQLVTREQNLQLVNLLGDAVAFSGDIVTLVKIAQDIQQIFLAYRRRLQELSPGGDAAALATTHRRMQRRRQIITEEKDGLSRELATLKKDVFERSSLDTSAMVHQLQQDYRKRFDQIQAIFHELQLREKSEKDPALRTQLTARIANQRQSHEQLKQHREETLAGLKKLSGQELNDKLTDLITRRHLERVRQIEERLRSLEDEELTLDEAEREERSRSGAGLEAGLFIAYGTAAEVISLKDDVWGNQRVAVSERINEAARGTARNLAVRQRLDELLADVSQQRCLPDMELPFRVYIASTGSFQVEPAIGRIWNKAVAERDPDLMQRFLEALDGSVRKRFEAALIDDDAMTAIQSNDIYNLGEAISAGALDAYLRQTRTSHLFFQVQTRPDELHADLQCRFLFHQEMLGLIVGCELKRESPVFEMFRYVGQVLFRGFEGTRPTAVYEILRPGSPFVRLMAKHHLPEWLSEARQNPDRKLQGLESAQGAPESESSA